MSRITDLDFDRRLGDWLEEGAQTIPDWAVEDALQRAHAAQQLRAPLRLPWAGPRALPSLNRLVPLVVGAIGALAVVSAFVLGLIAAPRIGVDQPTPSPDLLPTSSPLPTAPVSTVQPSGGLPRPIGGIEAIDVLPGIAEELYALIGLAATKNAVWTVAVTADPESGNPINRLIRIDATSREARPIAIPGAVGNLSPPVADGETVWTASAGGLHSVDAFGTRDVVTVPLTIDPREISVSSEGLWIARTGGTTLVNPQTSEVVREVSGHAGSRLDRIIGAPIFGSLWECAAGSLLRVDPVTGESLATIDLGAGDQCRYAVEVSGVNGLDDGVIPLFENAVVDPQSNTIVAEFDLGGTWSDVVNLDGRLWFEVGLRGSGEEGLVELDPATGRPAQTLTFRGSGTFSTTYMTGVLAQTSDYVWVLFDPTPDASDGPQIIRIPRSTLTG